MTPFAPLEPRASAVDACTEAIRRRILRGELAPGARLPPERTLAETFGVNRVTVRSALSRLATSRLLSVRQGSGYVVRDFRIDGGPDLLPGLVEIARGEHLGEVVDDLLLVRRHLARAVLDRLADGVEQKARAVIAAAVDRLEASVLSRADVETLAADDLAVIAAVVDATGSAVLRMCLNPVLAVVVSLPRLRDAIYADARQSVEAYRLLLGWLADPSPQLVPSLVEALAARDAMTVSRLHGRSKTASKKKPRRRTR